MKQEGHGGAVPFGGMINPRRNEKRRPTLSLRSVERPNKKIRTKDGEMNWPLLRGGGLAPGSHFVDNVRQ
jgi:hypothetical protein